VAGLALWLIAAVVPNEAWIVPSDLGSALGDRWEAAAK
jgi:hypothetical protein